MPIGSGLSSQLGIKAETTYGTPVTVDRFPEFLSESLSYKPNFVQGGGLYPGRWSQPGNRRVVTTSDGSGAVSMEVPFAKFGLILQALMGTTVTPVQQSSTTAYLQTHTLADPTGKSLTMQTGVPQTDGTVRAHTYAGCKVVSAEFSCGVDEILTTNLSIDAQSFTDQTALASASFTASNVFHFGQMYFKLGTFGSEAAVTGVRKVTANIDRSLALDKNYANGLGKKAEPTPTDYTKITFSVDTDFVSKADFLDRFNGQTSTSLIWGFVDTTAIASTFFPTWQLQVPGVFVDDGTPNVDGPGIVNPSFNLTWQYDGTNLPVITYMSTDTTV